MKCWKCPRRCLSPASFCCADSESPEVASVYAHKGEEPVLSGEKGISNIFFAHCNLHCCYCQNRDISGFDVSSERVTLHTVREIVDAVARSLERSENIVGLVSATQYSDLVAPIVEGLHARGLSPTVVYNTGGYERVEVIDRIAPYIDIFLPDFKYSDAELAQRYSNAYDYPDVAKAAISEMYKLKGSSLPTDDDGIAFRGLIVRHLVLPGCIDNSIGCLRWLSENLSPNIYVSLMAQYYPPEGVELPDELNRRLTTEEYDTVVEALRQFGFHRGWVQELESADCYKPHFGEKTVFGN